VTPRLHGAVRAAAPAGNLPLPRAPWPDAAETARLAALHEDGLLDAPADDELEAVVRLAAAVAGVPTATLNLVDASRQCRLTTVGFEGADSPRAESMCDQRSGIGLATCQRIVQRHGGRIWVEDGPGGGTSVRFLLPSA
jgi:hypothetical protein